MYDTLRKRDDKSKYLFSHCGIELYLWPLFVVLVYMSKYHVMVTYIFHFNVMHYCVQWFYFFLFTDVFKHPQPNRSKSLGIYESHIKFGLFIYFYHEWHSCLKPCSVSFLFFPFTLSLLTNFLFFFMTLLPHRQVVTVRAPS